MHEEITNSPNCGHPLKLTGCVRRVAERPSVTLEELQSSVAKWDNLKWTSQVFPHERAKKKKATINHP